MTTPPSQTEEYASQDAVLRRAALDAWEPRPAATVSEIASRHLYLSAEYSKGGGLVDFETRPFLREPMDCLGPDEPAQVVVFMGPIQGGKTVVGQGWLSSIIVANPGPTLWVTDTETKAELFSRKRFDLMVRDSPALRERVADPKSRSRDNTVRRKVFKGGDVEFVGAQSASGLTSNTFQNVVIDEADDHKANVSYAGSSISLAMGRQTDFGDLAKTLIVSSPKTRGDSEIEAWFLRGDQREFRIPCPNCGKYQPLHFREKDEKTGAWKYNLVWTPGNPASARYVCPHCKTALRNEDKNRMLPLGRWEPTRPDLGDGGKIRSYHLNALYLPVGSYSWEAMARQWESAVERMKAGDFDELRTFINTRLAETYEVPGDVLDPHVLRNLVDPDWPEDEIPEGVREITIGTDVQRHTRLEAMVVGWGVGWEAWMLDYHVIRGDPSGEDVWRQLDDVAGRTYTTSDGRTLRAKQVNVDRGDLSQRVMEYTGPRFRRGIYAVKGVEGTPRDAIWDKTVRWTERNKRRQSTYFTVRTVAAKDEIKRMLGVTAPGPFRLHIPERILKANPDILNQLCAERRVTTRDNRGRTHVKWEKIVEHRPNEALDTLVYALAAAHNLAMGGAKFYLENLKPPAAQKTKPNQQTGTMAPPGRIDRSGRRPDPERGAYDRESGFDPWEGSRSEW